MGSSVSEINRTNNAKCSICNKNFYLRPGAKIKSISKLNFCSQNCFRESISPNKKCPICSTNFRGKQRKYCSRSCSNKGRTGNKYDGSNLANKQRKNDKLKEILINLRGNKCERCCYNNIKILQIHHKIERHLGGTDAIENLELLCPNCHAENHYG